MSYAGPFFEDFREGEIIRHRPCLSIDGSVNLLWMAITLDYSPLYIDEAYASHTEFGRSPINPRYLSALAIGMATKDTSINTLAFLGLDGETIAEPVFPGDTICVESEVIEARSSQSRPNAGVVSWAHRAINQRGELVYEVRRSNLIYRRGQSPWSKLTSGEEAGAPHRGEARRTAVDNPAVLNARPWLPNHSPWLGRFLEDFSVGEVMVHRLGKTINQFDNAFSTALSLNAATLHLDSEYMIYHDYGVPVVQGPLTLGVAYGLSSLDLSINMARELGIGEARFTAPVFDGDTLHAVSEVVDVKDAGDHGIVTVRTTVYKDMFNAAVANYIRRLAIYSSKASPWVKIWRG